MPSLTRREFIKVGATTLAASALIPPARVLGNTFLPEGLLPMGRITKNSVPVRQSPSLSAHEIKSLWEDAIIPLQEVTLGDDAPAHNRVWYRLGDGGYVHSGSVQPVEIRTHTPEAVIPDPGCLGEITVPYTDAVWYPPLPHLVAYRLYYGTTHWIIGSVVDKTGKTWYHIREDQFHFHYYVDARHVYLFNPAELQPLSPDVPAEDKRIEVHLESQVVVAYEKDRPVFMSKASTGTRFRNGVFLTPTGDFTTYHKRPSRHMTSGNLAHPNSYDLPGVPWICYIDENGVAFHGTYWHNDFGRPLSHGCINLPSPAARWLYQWSTPCVPTDVEWVYKNSGTRVTITID